ncbi:MAG TPA: hypothetical protein VNH19_03875 [Candidatus Limnocylindrales bacterium]|nr:hypothetical protein [Candidatus Limnocylindrales bacterium]
MRIRINLISAAILFFLTMGQQGFAAQSKDDCSFPSGLQEEITKRFPETKLLRLTDLSAHDRNLFQRDHGNRCPGFAEVDFYGDTKPTFALVLISGETPKKTAELIIANQSAGVWTFRSLEKTDGTPVIWSQGPGNYADIYGRKTIRSANPVIVFCGYESWAILYAWTGETVDKVWLSD